METDLRRIFSKYGLIEKVILIMDNQVSNLWSVFILGGNNAIAAGINRSLAIASKASNYCEWKIECVFFHSTVMNIYLDVSTLVE